MKSIDVNCNQHEWYDECINYAVNKFGHCISTGNRIKMLQNINRKYNEIIKHINT